MHMHMVVGCKASLYERVYIIASDNSCGYGFRDDSQNEADTAVVDRWL